MVGMAATEGSTKEASLLYRFLLRRARYISEGGRRTKKARFFFEVFDFFEKLRTKPNMPSERFYFFTANLTGNSKRTFFCKFLEDETSLNFS